MDQGSFTLTLSLFALAWGAIWGSFLNVVIYRVPAGASLIRPPSHCPRCQTQLAWTDNIPILGWVILRGRCRYCKVRIAIRYPLVETLTALLSLAVWRHVAAGRLVAIDGPLLEVAMAFLFLFFFVAILIAIAFIDFDHTIVPHPLTLAGTFLGLVAGFVLSRSPVTMDIWPAVDGWDALIGVAIGGGAIFLVIKGYALVRGIEGMGWGDFTLMGMCGAWVGWRGVVAVLFLASVQGLIAVVLHSVDLRLRGGTAASSAFLIEDIHGEEQGAVQRPALAKLAVPFGPFIALAAVEYLLAGQWLIPWVLGVGR